jgi:hypothetical protein
MHKKKFLLGVIVLLFLFKGFSAYAGFGTSKVSVRNRNFSIDYAKYGFMVDTIRVMRFLRMMIMLFMNTLQKR